MGTERVTESFAFSGGTVDRSGKYPIIRGVLLCGRESKWKRRYANEAFAGDKIKVYEDRPVFLDHTNEKGSRKYGDHFGWVEPGTVRHNADGLPVGDIGCKPTHKELESVLWDVENRPQNCMMSHVADIESVQAPNGWREVKECKHIESVDIVTSGATTSTMLSEGGSPVATTVKQYLTKFGPRFDLDQLQKVRELVKEDDMGGAAMPDGAPEGDAVDPKDAITAGFKAAVMAIVDKVMSGDMDRKEGRKKIDKLFAGHSDATDEPDDTEGDDTGTETDDTGKAAEGGKGKKAEPVKEAIDPWALMDECAKEGFSPSAIQLKSLKFLPDPADRSAFIREQKGLAAHTNPKSKGRAGEVEKVKEGGDGKAAGGMEEARQVMANLAKDCRGAK